MCFCILAVDVLVPSEVLSVQRAFYVVGNVLAGFCVLEGASGHPPHPLVRNEDPCAPCACVRACTVSVGFRARIDMLSLL